jgi:hypothetical protein
MASSNDSQVLQNIVQYELEARSYQQQQMDVDIPDTVALERSLDQTIQELEDRVRGQRAELAKVTWPTSNLVRN